jgi:hypothetical protein
MPDTSNLPINPRRPSGLRTTDDLRQHLRATIEQAQRDFLERQQPSVGLFEWVSDKIRPGRDSPGDEPAREIGKIFFHKWFAHRDFFLFRKNLTVTNMQYAELLALLRTHVNTDLGDTDDVRVDIHRLQFLSYGELVLLIDGLLSDFADLDSGVGLTDEQLDTTVLQLLPILRRTVLLERLHGSCITFLPRFMWFDLERIAGEAGYVHSCGRVLYIRNIEKTTRSELRGALDRYFDEIRFSPRRDLPLRLHIYTHDDATPADRQHADELRHGLDSIKIHLDKFHIGNEPLTTLLPELEHEFVDRLVVVGPPGHRAKHDATDPSHSIWLIVDGSPAAAQPGFGDGSRFLICYDQWWRNRNPLHALDENKPGWVGPVTIPHALLGAMINITRPWRRERSYTIRLCDPFGGSGSTMLESLKFDDSHLQCESGDVDDICELLASDNAEVFSAPPERVSRWIELLERVAISPAADEDVTGSARLRSPASVSELRHVVSVARELARRVDASSNGYIPADVVSRLSALALDERLVFYTLLKAQSRHLTDVARGKEPPDAAISSEASRLAEELKSLHNIRELIDTAAVPASREPESPTPLLRFYDEWSLATSFVVDSSRAATRLTRADVRDLPARSYDVIVADPPYGFNTGVGAEGLAALYREAFAAILQSLKSEGQLVIALPDRSLSGRTTPSFTQKEFCIRLLLALAEEQDRQIYSVADAFPSTRRSDVAPYYWESERALRRAVLHLRVRDRPLQRFDAIPN